MTTRLVMAVVLMLMLLAQAWGLVTVWRDDPLNSLAVTRKKEARVQAVAPEKRVSLQPVLPEAPPDLNQGYIFNAERNLAVGGGKDGQSQNAGNVGIDKVQYSGSIIVGDNFKALLCYPLGGQPGAPPGGAKLGFLRVVVGDTVNGYKVTEILPRQITFSRGGQKITKLLYEKTKERVQAQTPQTREPNREPNVMAPAASPGPPPPRQDVPQILVPGKPFPPAPSDEELRKTPLRRRPEPQRDPQAPNAKNLFQMLIEKQQERNKALGRGEKNDAQ